MLAGRWHLGIRDARNVPKPTGVGGPRYAWLVTGRPTPRTPTTLSFPSTVQGTLRHANAVALYTFSTTQVPSFDVDVRAKRKAAQLVPAK